MITTPIYTIGELAILELIIRQKHSKGMGRKMKKVWYVDCGCEHYTDLINYLNEKCDCLFYSRKQAIRHLKERARTMKELVADELKKEKKNGNTITIDCYVALAPNNYDETNFFDLDYRLVDSRYLCGRY